MKCPVCKDTNLVMTERKAIEIDYCPECRGVWLDRGELDKIIERTASENTPTPQAPPGFSRDSRREDPRRDYDRHHEGKRYDDDRYHQGQKHYKRKSLLGEIFDF